MGVVYNPAVQEEELCTAHGLTVYGKINRYEYIVFDHESQDCYISIRIVDAEGNNIVSLNMGNNIILDSVFAETIDNFLYWIKTENPNGNEIVEQIFCSLCEYDSIFNHRMQTRKFRDIQDAKARKAQEEREAKEAEQRAQLAEYCEKHGYFTYYRYGEVIIVEGLMDRVRELMRSADDQKWIAIIDFVKKYPSNDEIKLIFSGNLEEAEAIK